MVPWENSRGNPTKMPVVNFDPMYGNLPDIGDDITGDSSTDQKVLCDLAKGVALGHITREASVRKIGPLKMA